MYYNTTGGGISIDNSVARVYNRLDDSKPSLDQWNTFACLWMPDKVEWYINDETAKIAQEIFEDPNKRALFYAARDRRPEDIKMAADMLERFKETNPDG